MFKEQKGITLVALVITIIVLLILAGVSLSLVAGEKGVATRAKNAVASTEEATANQEIQLSIAEAQMAYFEEWAKDKTSGTTVALSTYYGDSQYYTNNCTSASSVTPKVSGEVVTVTYVSKKGTTYTAAFNMNNPASTYNMGVGTSISPLPVTGSGDTAGTN